MKPRFRVWVEVDGQPGFGDGVYQLLLGVERLGSINQAAKSLSMSYRQAWGHIRKTETRLGEKLLIRQVGGESGGGATLTPAGREWLENYRRFQDTVEDAVDRIFREVFIR